MLYYLRCASKRFYDMSSSIGDVAKRARVSMSTVSYVINGGPRNVRAELSNRVLAAIKELDYRPSRIARTMVTGRSGAVGVIHAPIRYDIHGATFVQAVLNGIAAEAQRLRHDLLLYTNALTDDPERALADVDDGRSDGLIVISPDQNDSLIDLLAKRSPKMVIVTGCQRAGVPYLVSDNESGITQAFTHLYELGHRKIGHVYGQLTFADGKERYDAFLKLVATYETQLEKHWLIGGRFEGSKSYQYAQRMLKLPKRPTAVIAANDNIASGIIQCAKDMGLKIPEDLSVIGFDDTMLAQMIEPPLTTVAQSLESFGTTAVRYLDQLLKGESVPTLSRFPTSLTVRRTTSSPKEDIS